MSKDHQHREVVVNLKAMKDHSQYLRQINQWVFDILKNTHLNTQQNTYMLTTQYEETQNYPKILTKQYSYTAQAEQHSHGHIRTTTTPYWIWIMRNTGNQ